ncbi:hypothetical protein GCM10027074_33630 [Streptomyces deserti]
MSTKQLIETPGYGAMDPRPVDLSTMRATVRRLLGPDDGPDVLPSTAAELDTLTATLRGHIELLAPEIEQLAKKLPEESVPRYCALACAGEARGKLRAAPGLSGGVVYARKLAHVLNALCDHYQHIHAGRETPEQDALRRLGEHCASCPSCMSVNEDGGNAGVPCETGDQLYEEYRQARRGVAATH